MTRGDAGAAWLAGALVLAACLAVVVATPGDAYWINDCGNKALLAERLLESGYRDGRFEYRGALVDPEGRWFPIPPPFAKPHQGRFLSTYPPAYSALAAPALGLFGTRGLRLPAALGAAASAALFVLWAAPAVGRGWALAGALVLGLASPLFFYGVTVWEHTLTVALALGAWLLVMRDGALRWGVAGGLVGLACWLREEMALLLLAFAVAAALTRTPPRRLGAFGAGALLPVALLLVFNQGYHGHPLGGHVLANLGARGGGAVSRLDPLAGLLGGFGLAAAERRVFAALGVLLPAAGFALAGLGGFARRALVPLLALSGVCAWGLAAGRLVTSTSPLETLVAHNGLLLQWPMVVLAGVGLRLAWRRPACAPQRAGLVSGLVFGLLVLLAGVAFPSDYGVQVGAGVHWGPRVLLPVLPVLVLLAVLAVRRRGRAAVAAWGLLAAVGLASTGLAVDLLHEQKTEGARAAREIRRLDSGAILTAHPYLAQHLASLWGERPMLLATDVASLQAAMLAIHRRGTGDLLLVLPAGAPPIATPQGVTCRPAARTRGRLRYSDLDIQRCTGVARRAR